MEVVAVCESLKHNREKQHSNNSPPSYDGYSAVSVAFRNSSNWLYQPVTNQGLYPAPRHGKSVFSGFLCIAASQTAASPEVANVSKAHVNRLFVLLQPLAESRTSPTKSLQNGSPSKCPRFLKVKNWETGAIQNDTLHNSSTQVRCTEMCFINSCKRLDGGAKGDGEGTEPRLPKVKADNDWSSGKAFVCRRRHVSFLPWVKALRALICMFSSPRLTGSL